MGGLAKLKLQKTSQPSGRKNVLRGREPICCWIRKCEGVKKNLGFRGHLGTPPFLLLGPFLLRYGISR